MFRLILAIVAAASLFAAVSAQKAPTADRMDEVIHKLEASRRSQAKMLLARASGTGRSVLRSALVAAGKIPPQPTKPALWSDKKALQLTYAQLGKSQRDLFASVHAAMSKSDQALLVEMLRVRAALPRK
ncbi:MAG: hypothetical protein M9921_11180 [Fimbriimonadaceae bacterium]|nr:hypothetical protein [Fimbriimonadaceae bacterium]